MLSKAIENKIKATISINRRGSTVCTALLHKYYLSITLVNVNLSNSAIIYLTLNLAC